MIATIYVELLLNLSLDPRILQSSEYLDKLNHIPLSPERLMQTLQPSYSTSLRSPIYLEMEVEVFHLFQGRKKYLGGSGRWKLLLGNDSGPRPLQHLDGHDVCWVFQKED